MLARYKIYRGKRPPTDPLPDGIRKDTRKHTKHCLRPSEAMVAKYLGDPSAEAWEAFTGEYLDLVRQRYTRDAAPFDQLAELAQEQDVYLGCSCPTATNPDVQHCHTVLALGFMQAQYPQLEVEFPV